MDGATIAKLIVLLCLAALFVAAVLVTPRIWHSNEPGDLRGTAKDPEREGAGTPKGGTRTT